MARNVHDRKCPVQNDWGTQEILDPCTCNQVIAVLRANSHNSSEADNPGNTSNLKKKKKSLLANQRDNLPISWVLSHTNNGHPRHIFHSR